MKSFKVGVFGEKSVGKSTLIGAASNNSDNNSIIYASIDGPVQLKFEEFHNSELIKDTDLLLLLFQFNNYNSFKFLQDNIQKIKRNQKIALIQTKFAIPNSNENQINQQEIESFIKQNNCLFYLELSLFNSQGIDALLYHIEDNVNNHPNIIYDPSNTLNKFKKILELVTPKKEVAFSKATETFWYKNAIPSHVKPTDEKDYKWEPFDNSSAVEFGKTQGDWFVFKGKLSVPKEYNPEKHHLRIVFHVQRNYSVKPWDDNFPAGPEGRIWLNGKNIGAVDEFHDSFIIKDKDQVENSQMEVTLFTCRCFSEHILTRFGVQVVDKATEAFVYRLSFILDLLKEMNEESNNDRIRLIRLADAAVRALDLRDLNGPELLPIRKIDPNNDCFYKSVTDALEILRSIKSIRTESPEEDGPTTSIIGYSHLDTCWLWPFSIIHFKSTNTASSMVYLLENPPDEFQNPVNWHFLATAAQHYTWIEEDEPELFKNILDEAKKGRWVIDGVSWLEHDTILPCGESIVRQMLYGTKYFEKKLGYQQKTLFLPDCFGFSGNIPQILRGFGVDSFITSKISWSEYNTFPYHTFLWRGIDGSDIYAHFISTPSPWRKETSTYTGVATVREIVQTYDAYQQKDVIRTTALHTAGNGDGGGGITEQMVWTMNMFAELPRLQNVPRVRFPTLAELFDDIRKKKDYLPIWDDELYLEYHRGTLTSQESVKTQNRRLECHLHNSEFLLTVIQQLKGLDIKNYVEKIEEIWHETLLYQFHDAIPGTSVNEANNEILQRGKKALQSIREIEEDLAKQLSSYVKSDILINTTSSDLVLNNSDKVIPSLGWRTISQDLIKMEKVVTDFYLRNPKNEEHTVLTTEYEAISTTQHDTFEYDASSQTVKTNKLIIKINKKGGFQSVKDIETGREFIQQNDQEHSHLLYYEDRSIQYPAWDIQFYHKEMELDSPILLSITKEGNDKLILFYEIPEMTENPNCLHEKTTIKEIMTFNGSLIDIIFDVFWTQHDKLLKFVLPTTIRSREAKFGIQFGHISRSTHWNTSRDMARFEASGRWADLSDATGGISLMSDVKCGFDVHNQIMMLSLLKAPMQTDKWTDFGRRHFVVRLNFHSKAFDSTAPKLSNSLITRPVYSQSNENNKEDVNQQFIKVDNENIIVETVKPAEEGSSFIVRLYEAIGGFTQANISFPLLPRVSAVKTNLKEEEIETFENTNENSFKITLKPFEIITMKVSKQ